MIVRNSEIEMPPCRHSPRIDTLELKAQIVRKLGHQKAVKYFSYLSRLLSLKLCKSEFDKLCISTIGRKNLSLHNRLIGSILKNASVAKTPPLRGSRVETLLNVKNGYKYQGSNLQMLSGEVFPPSPRKGRSSSLRVLKSRDGLSSLGPHGKIQSMVCDEPAPAAQEQQSATELFSLGSRPPAEVVSVEEGEEVEQVAASPSIQSRSPVRAPLGIPINMAGSRKFLCNGPLSAIPLETCHNSCELPDTRSLRKRLEQKLEMEGLRISVDCVNLLNNGLDVFLKRLIKPCMELAGSRGGHEHLKQVGLVKPALNGILSERCMQRSSHSLPASLLDFRVAMELNPQILGEDWPIQLEKICLRASEE
ncbi:PREDICTED: uncharacterized protein LOC104608064 [Nelumbo nucifera]|uniref:Uncharacterized protein LOC104608064 n=2 Tax=Nelumbo nucifera TaxID=4432 RepID=A0A1U8AVQ9_NELNU|nr:PREDICTED: uncharacterized protein LOC104608064 [Nelumbo nucifera]XP_010272237.1 PREDICTED: uncharacterized protein LOC104608064 [Nelumbo nucifera]DAD41467.1 TPA_asm: hypothetical protein HUJ06_015791 [Nelumbo nucifera]